MPSSGVVQFETACGSVFGSAYRKGGYNETHYDIIEAKRLTPPHGDRGPARPSMVESKAGVGCFDVVGQVTCFFDDGVFTVEAHGFDFWVSSDEIDKPVKLGDWVQLDVRNLTLYVGGEGGDVPAPRAAASCVCILCGGCGAGISVPELSEAFRSRLAELVRSESLICAIRELCMGPELGLAEAKILAEHITSVRGACNRCHLALQGSGQVNCPTCKSVNFDW